MAYYKVKSAPESMLYVAMKASDGLCLNLLSFSSSYV